MYRLSKTQNQRQLPCRHVATVRIFICRRRRSTAHYEHSEKYINIAGREENFYLTANKTEEVLQQARSNDVRGNRGESFKPSAEEKCVQQTRAVRDYSSSAPQF